MIKGLLTMLFASAFVLPAVAESLFGELPAADPTGWYPLGADVNLGALRARELKTLHEKLEATKSPVAARAMLSRRVQELNQDVTRSLPRAPGNDLSLSEIRAIQTSMGDHPVVGTAATKIYDPDLRVGFCFGRAAYAHFEFLARGVPAKDIAKIFAVGNLRHRGGPWRFHVATIVRDDSGRWWAIDSLQKEVLGVEAWMRAVSGMDLHPSAPTVRFYVTDPAKFQPLFGAYDPLKLQDPLFKSYFVDLARWFHESRMLPKIGSRAGVRRLSDMEAK